MSRFEDKYLTSAVGLPDEARRLLMTGIKIHHVVLLMMKTGLWTRSSDSPQ